MDPVDRDFDEWDAEQDALEDEARESADARDFTPEPPAYLDPHWVLRMRARIESYKATGVIDWMNKETLAA